MTEQRENLESRYQQAIDCYKKAQYQPAMEMFQELGDYADSPEYVRKCSKRLLYQVGNQVTFGNYHGMPITWRILAVNGNMYLLFADRILDYQPYQDRYVDTCWRDSTLRKWLNRDFLKAAFTVKEQMSILSCRVENRSNPVFFTNGGLNTADKLFCLSYDEAENYFSSDEDRATGEWWWLRTPGNSLLTTSAVYTDGSVYIGGINANYPTCGVRPAMWVLVKI